MALYRYQFFAQDTAGNIASGALVTVRKESDSSLATIYSDSAGTTPKSNPFLTDGNGYAFFYSAPGLLRVQCNIGIYSTEFRDVVLGSNALQTMSDVSISGLADLDILRWDVATASWINRKVRERLSANRTYYVRTDGNDANTGLSNSAGGAFATIQRAFNVAGDIDAGSNSITVQLGNNGVYAGAALSSPLLGANPISVVGSAGSPSSYFISSAGIPLSANNGARLNFSGVRLISSASSGLYSGNGAIITANGAFEMGACSFAQMYAESGIIIVGANYSIVGGAYVHWYSSTGKIVSYQRTVTLAGTPAFSGAFAWASMVGVLFVPLCTFTGAATGSRYIADGNGVVQTNGAGATYLPGNAAGTTNTGGQYV